jgi:hypothetical protein
MTQVFMNEDNFVSVIAPFGDSARDVSRNGRAVQVDTSRRTRRKVFPAASYL